MAKGQRNRYIQTDRHAHRERRRKRGKRKISFVFDVFFIFFVCADVKAGNLPPLLDFLVDHVFRDL